jgi:hypothetical protein
MQKYILKKILKMKTQDPSRYYNSIINLKSSHNIIFQKNLYKNKTIT